VGLTFNAETFKMHIDSPSGFLHYRSILGCIDQDYRAEGMDTQSFDRDLDVSHAKIFAKFEGYKLIFHESSSNRAVNFYMKDQYFIELTINKNNISITVLSSKDDAQKYCVELLKSLEEFRRKDDAEDGIWVDFSYMSANGPKKNTEFIRAPLWKDIIRNYPQHVGSSVGGVIKMAEPWQTGRLLIWHGKPGTGKTFAIRALMMEWKETFNFLVITDPERFTADPGYYYNVASKSAGRYDYEDEDDDFPESKKRRTLFILEDSADLIIEASRSAHYDKVGKFLNMTDGLFGQGRQDLFLITFNEEVDKIDQAFLRPGRCISRVEFPVFGPKDAKAWLKDKGMESAEIREDKSLADLYSLVVGAKAPTQLSAKTGFGVAVEKRKE
jgi:hypothetical protein